MQQTKNLVGWLAFITCVVMGVYFLIPDKPVTADNEELNQWQARSLADSNFIVEYRSMYLAAKDTIIMLQVQKGQVEIEKNRLEEKLKASSNSYKEKKQLKDTAKAIQICDSIVYTYIPGYLQVDSTLSWYHDTLQKYTMSTWESLYKIGDTIATRLTYTDSGAIELKKENIKLKSENRADKRKVFKAGILGAALGVIAMLIGEFF